MDKTKYCREGMSIQQACQLDTHPKISINLWILINLKSSLVRLAHFLISIESRRTLLIKLSNKKYQGSETAKRIKLLNWISITHRNITHQMRVPLDRTFEILSLELVKTKVQQRLAIKKFQLKEFLKKIVLLEARVDIPSKHRNKSIVRYTKKMNDF